MIVLDHRMHDEIATRRLRVVKYRGSVHGTNEYPFLVTDRPAGLAHHLDLAHLRGLHRTGVAGRAATGRDAGRRRLPRLHRLVSGIAGTGKTTLAASAVDAACARGESALFVSFEESPTRSSAT